MCKHKSSCGQGVPRRSLVLPKEVPTAAVPLTGEDLKVRGLAITTISIFRHLVDISAVVTALAAVATKAPILAGRLETASIGFKTAGIGLTESILAEEGAWEEVSLSNLLLLKTQRLIHRTPIVEVMDRADAPLVEVTILLGETMTILGISMSRVLGDAFSYFQLISAWNTAFRRQEIHFEDKRQELAQAVAQSTKGLSWRERLKQSLAARENRGSARRVPLYTMISFIIPDATRSEFRAFASKRMDQSVSSFEAIEFFLVYHMDVKGCFMLRNVRSSEDKSFGNGEVRSVRILTEQPGNLRHVLLPRRICHIQDWSNVQHFPCFGLDGLHLIFHKREEVLRDIPLPAVSMHRCDQDHTYIQCTGIHLDNVDRLVYALAARGIRSHVLRGEYFLSDS